jgi:porin
MKMTSRSIGFTAGGRALLGPIVAVATVLGLAPGLAAPPTIQIPTEDTFGAGGPSDTGPFGFLNGVSRSDFLLGDMWGLRTALAKYGISFALQETSEVLGNVTGGAQRGAAYDGLTQMAVQVETNRAFGWYGGLFNASALQIHGNNLSSTNLLTLQTASGIEADRATRLWELWYQQKFLEEDRLDIKIGQQSLDQEFMVNANGAYLINTMFGWPMVPSADLRNRGPNGVGRSHRK